MRALSGSPAIRGEKGSGAFSLTNAVRELLKKNKGVEAAAAISLSSIFTRKHPPLVGQDQ